MQARCLFTQNDGIKYKIKVMNKTALHRYWTTSGCNTSPGMISNSLQTLTFVHYSKLIEQSSRRVYLTIQFKIIKTYRIFRIKNQYSLYLYGNITTPTFFR